MLRFTYRLHREISGRAERSHGRIRVLPEHFAGQGAILSGIDIARSTPLSIWPVRTRVHVSKSTICTVRELHVYNSRRLAKSCFRDDFSYRGRIQHLDTTAQYIPEHTNAEMATAVADIGSSHKVENVCIELTGELGVFDILVNNASICPDALITEMDPTEFENVIRVNLLGKYFTTRAVLSHMQQLGYGKLARWHLNTTSRSC